jgi:methionyl-tRNA synthetase
MKAKRRHYWPGSNDKYDGIIRKSFSDFEFHLIITQNFAKIHHDTVSFEFFQKTVRPRDFIEEVEQLKDAKGLF